MPAPNRVIKNCEICGVEMSIKPSHLKRRKTCSKVCDGERKRTMYSGKDNPNYGNRGEKNPMFKTGEKISRYGYRMIYKPDHPNSQKDGYILEHRYVMSEFLGRPLSNEEHIHHKDENKLNNDIRNLEIISKSDHSKLHRKNKIIIRDELGRITGVSHKEESA